MEGLKDNVVFFYTPPEINKFDRLPGLVMCVQYDHFIFTVKVCLQLAEKSFKARFDILLRHLKYTTMELLCRKRYL